MKKQKWLLRKQAQSKASRKWNPRYADERIARHFDTDYLDELPQREGMSRKSKYLETGLIKRWLHTQIGRDFDNVYADYLTRIQPKYRDAYADAIFYYVARNLHWEGDYLYGNFFKEQRRMIIAKKNGFSTNTKIFYINPSTNRLAILPHFPSRRKTKNMNKVELRQFREKEQKKKRAKGTKKDMDAYIMSLNEKKQQTKTT